MGDLLGRKTRDGDGKGAVRHRRIDRPCSDNRLVRPSKSVLDMKAKSVKKKWKDKRFAAGVDRSIIEKGAEMLGVQIGDLIQDTIMGMRDVAEAIGLKGEVDS